MIYLNGRNLDITKFPNNEVLIRDYIMIKEENTIKVKFESNEDLFNLILIKEHIDEKEPNAKTELIMPYLPYSRMDRTEGVNVFTLKYICKIINKLNFERVTICEPHSEVSMALLDRIKVINSSIGITREVMEKLNFNPESNDYLFYPDAGAEKRYSKQVKYEKVLTGNKERDYISGNIKSLTIAGDKPTNPFRVIIVDDLCSRGGTFMMSAEKLKELGATEIYLVVTHCENTILDGDILKKDLIKGVYTTNSIIDERLIPNELLDKISISKIV
jgi:ribose-phosphate pyrophosphokinase